MSQCEVREMQYVKNTRVPYCTWSHFAVYKPASCFSGYSDPQSSALRQICNILHGVRIDLDLMMFFEAEEKTVGWKTGGGCLLTIGLQPRYHGLLQIAAGIKHRLTRKVKMSHGWIFRQDEDLKWTSQSTQKYFQRQQNKGSAMAITVPRHKRHRKPAG